MSLVMPFIASICAIMLAGMEVDLFIPSFPELIHTFNLTPFLVQMTVSVNFLSYCICSLFAGNLGDRYGRRPIMLWGLGIFIVGSILCVLAPTFPMLIAGRFLQGAGMAGPAVLAYVIFTDLLPYEKQPKYMGMLNSVITFSMAFAPVIGSIVNQYYSWRGNFWVLLGVGIFAFVMVFCFTPHTTKPDPTVKLSLKSYIPLFQSREFLLLCGAIVFLVTGYWIFIAMGPILYMESMGVPLTHFGFYQGMILFIYAFVSGASPLWMPLISKKNSLRVAMIALCMVSCLMVGVSVYLPDTPWIITVLMIGFIIPFVAPINFLYPDVLSAVPESRARASALVNCGRLLCVGLGVEGVSYVYTGFFTPVAIVIAGVTLISVVCILKSHVWKNS